MNKSKAHYTEITPLFLTAKLYPDRLTTWNEESLYHVCSYCGSLHPQDLARFIQEECCVAKLADMKYGYPHKLYIDIPNPEAGNLISTGRATYQVNSQWTQDEQGTWHEAPQLAPATIRKKFYTVHLIDATDEEKHSIEEHLHIRFKFGDYGKLIGWSFL